MLKRDREGDSGIGQDRRHVGPILGAGQENFLRACELVKPDARGIRGATAVAARNLNGDRQCRPAVRQATPAGRAYSWHAAHRGLRGASQDAATRNPASLDLP